MIDEIVVEAGVKIPMRDGTLLDAMIWRPAAPRRYPVLIERVAYELAWRATENGEFYARHGYVVVEDNAELGGVTAYELRRFLGGKIIRRRAKMRSRKHLRLIVNRKQLPMRASHGDDAA